MDLWKLGKDNPLEYIEKAAQRQRLKEKGLDDCIPYCHTADSTDVIPVYRNGEIIKL
jgi:phosphosulfolactate phosphohydrolase-like enzyme